MKSEQGGESGEGLGVGRRGHGFLWETDWSRLGAIKRFMRDDPNMNWSDYCKMGYRVRHIAFRAMERGDLCNHVGRDPRDEWGRCPFSQKEDIKGSMKS